MLAGLDELASAIRGLGAVGALDDVAPVRQALHRQQAGHYDSLAIGDFEQEGQLREAWRRRWDALVSPGAVAQQGSPFLDGLPKQW